MFKLDRCLKFAIVHQLTPLISFSFFFVVHFCSVAVCVCQRVCQRVCQCVRYPIFKHLQNVKWRNSDEIWTSLSASLNRRTLVQSQFLANFVRIIYLVAVVVAVVFALIFCFVLKSREICLGFNGKQTPIRECVQYTHTHTLTHTHTQQQVKDLISTRFQW